MALLFFSTIDSAARWRHELARIRPELEVRVWPEIGDPAEIDYALVWRPQPGLLAALPNLKLILSLGAGVDHVLKDPQLPRGVPIVRLVDPYLIDAMSEYVTLQVLRLHRQDLDYRAQQAAEIWRELPQKNACRAAGRHSRIWRDRAGCRSQTRRPRFSCLRLEPQQKDDRGLCHLCRRGGIVAVAPRDRNPRLPVAADRGDRGHPVRPHLCPTALRRRPNQCRPRRASRGGRFDPGARLRPTFRRRRSTSSARSRCRRGILSGITRAFSSHRTLPASPTPRPRQRSFSTTSAATNKASRCSTKSTRHAAIEAGEPHHAAVVHPR